MKKKILILIHYQIEFQLFFSMIEKMKKNKKYDIHLCAWQQETADTISQSIPGIKVDSDYVPSIINHIKPTLVICQEIWPAPTAAILTVARENNIPILMYDHGTMGVKGRYLLEKDEYAKNYRSDLSLCYKVACWGQRGKECWLDYGVRQEKLILTGALQYDALYKKKINKLWVYQQLNLDPSKKIILFFTAIGHPSNTPHGIRVFKNLLRSLEKYVSKNPDYILVVKPHPVSMMRMEKPFDHSPQTKLIANSNEKYWPGMIIIDVDDVVATSHIVVAYASSAVISPLIFKIPIIYLDTGEAFSTDFYEYSKDVFYHIRNGRQLPSLIKKIETNGKNKIKASQSEKLAVAMNHNNDGAAGERFIQLVDSILEEADHKKNFYPQTIEEEFLERQLDCPHLPYPYQNLVMYYSKRNDFINASKWFKKYFQKFHQPQTLYNRMSHTFFRRQRKPQEIKEFLGRFRETQLLTPTHLFKLAIAHRELQEWQEAAELLKCLLEKVKQRDFHTHITYELGLIYLLKGEPARAIPFFKRALSKSAGIQNLKHRIYFRMGEAFSILKEFTKARFYLKKCLKYCPQHQAAMNMFKKIPGKANKKGSHHAGNH